MLSPQGRSGTLEVCIDRTDALPACVQGGAHRVELCAALELGGLTPSAGAMQLAARCPLPVHALIRPRSGDFIYVVSEIEQMIDDIAMARQSGLAGVVIGAATRRRDLDVPALQRLLVAADGLSTTLHRVVDTLDDPVGAVDIATLLGFDRILTSGGARCARDGAATLGAMQAAAAGRIEIMAGAGLAAADVLAIGRETGIRVFHGSCTRQSDADHRLVSLGFTAKRERVIDVGRMAAMRSAIDALYNPGLSVRESGVETT